MPLRGVPGAAPSCVSTEARRPDTGRSLPCEPGRCCWALPGRGWRGLRSRADLTLGLGNTSAPSAPPTITSSRLGRGLPPAARSGVPGRDPASGLPPGAADAGRSLLLPGPAVAGLLPGPSPDPSALAAAAVAGRSGERERERTLPVVGRRGPRRLTGLEGLMDLTLAAAMAAASSASSIGVALMVSWNCSSSCNSKGGWVG